MLDNENSNEKREKTPLASILGKLTAHILMVFTIVLVSSLGTAIIATVLKGLLWYITFLFF